MLVLNQRHPRCARGLGGESRFVLCAAVRHHGDCLCGLALRAEQDGKAEQRERCVQIGVEGRILKLRERGSGGGGIAEERLTFRHLENRR